MEDEDANDMKNTSGYQISVVGHTRLGLADFVSVYLPAGLGLVPAVSGMVN
jgi:hypothetical protein